MAELASMAAGDTTVSTAARAICLASWRAPSSGWHALCRSSPHERRTPDLIARMGAIAVDVREGLLLLPGICARRSTPHRAAILNDNCSEWQPHTETIQQPLLQAICLEG